MPAEPSLLLIAGSFVAAAAGWLLGRYRREQPPQLPGGGSRALSEDYFRGLRFLLNEEPDKALEVFLRMVDVDNETVETHFALGSLYRRRGQVDRAIRVHENIMARPALSEEHRLNAMFALAEDYFRAGLFDRAEQLFRQLANGEADGGGSTVDVPGRASSHGAAQHPGHGSAAQRGESDTRAAHRPDALRYLLRIYEQQRDWEHAIDAHARLVRVASPEHPTAIAHYHCELAEQARAAGDYVRTREHLRRAREVQRHFPRAALIRADLALDMDEPQLAVSLCQRVVERHPRLLALALPRVMQAVRASRDPDLKRRVHARISPEPDMRAELAYAGIVAGLENEAFVRECLPDLLREEPSLGEIVRAVAGEPAQLSDAQRGELAAALARVLRRTQRYRCVDCGFASAAHFWQCPGCRSWDAFAPAALLDLTPVRRTS